MKKIASSGLSQSCSRASWTQTFLGVIGPIKTSDIYPEKKLYRPDDYEALGNGKN